MDKLHLIMPMGGCGQRFFDKGFVIPKPLIEIKGKPFFFWSAMSVRKYIPECDLTFVVLKEHIENFDIKNKILNFFPDARIVVIDHVLKGAVLTCMAGVEEISDDLPIIFNDCDHMFGCSELANLDKSDAELFDGFLLTFVSDSPKFSYARCDSEGFVTETAEKNVISHDAICGAYYFRNKNVFLSNAEEYLKKCSYSEYFMSGIYNCMVKNGLKSGIIHTDFHVSFGTPDEYAMAENRTEFEVFI